MERAEPEFLSAQQAFVPINILPLVFVRREQNVGLFSADVSVCRARASNQWRQERRLSSTSFRPPSARDRNATTSAVTLENHIHGFGQKLLHVLVLFGG
jgi:hypothetical protein